VTGLDPNAGMLAVAAQLDDTVDWRQGFAEQLPFPEASFDAVVSQFGLMFFRDRSAAIEEMLRVLRPGARIAVAVWAALEESPAYSLEVALLQRVAGSAAADALRAPFVLGDRAELEVLFAEAGVAELEIASLTATAHFPSIRRMVEADLRGWLPVMGVELPEDQIAEILAAAESELSAFLSPEGTIVFPSPGHIVMGRNTV
jgi:ubiquinone/menaquinone biosynthesis C-methylase UbiE